MIEWLRIGDWIVNSACVSALRYEDRPKGPKVEIFLAGDPPHSAEGGFSATGEEATAIWEWWLARSVDP
jgi:hypothetical protein